MGATWVDEFMAERKKIKAISKQLDEMSRAFDQTGNPKISGELDSMATNLITVEQNISVIISKHVDEMVKGSIPNFPNKLPEKV